MYLLLLEFFPQIVSEAIADYLFPLNLADRLTNHGIDAPNLFNKLVETKSVIAGSYPLQVYLGEYWEDSDLDIFTENIFQLCLYFNRLCGQRNMFVYQRSILDEVSIFIFGDNTGSCYIHTGDFQLFEFETKKHLRIQLISSVQYRNTDTISAFDLGFCKVAFDGQQLLMSDKRSVLTRRYSFDLEKEFSQPLDFEEKCRKVQHMLKTAKRIVKYQKRGFEIPNWKEYLLMAKRCEETLQWNEQ